MLYDRPYMRDDPMGDRASPVTWLIGVLAGAFVVQLALGSWFGLEGAVAGQLAVTIPALRAGHLWTLATYGLLHDPFVSLPSNLLTSVCCLLMLYFLGRELLPLLGRRRFWSIVFGSAIAGGIGWAAVNWRHGGALFGPTAVIDAMLVIYACFFPNQELTFLLFFLIPVRLKPKHIAIAVATFDLAGFSFFEVLGKPSPFGMPHSAHLAGLATGWIYYRFLHQAEWRLFPRRAEAALPVYAKAAAREAAAIVAVPSARDSLRAEVDRILDKINSEGFGALTAEEKRVLDEARELLSRR